MQVQQTDGNEPGQAGDGGLGLLSKIIGGNQQQTINFKLDGAGVRIAAFCCILQAAMTMVLIPAIAVVLWSFAIHVSAVDKRVDDVKLDIATVVRSDINSLKDGEKAIRAYINTGRMPVQQQQKKQEQ